MKFLKLLLLIVLSTVISICILSSFGFNFLGKSLSITTLIFIVLIFLMLIAFLLAYNKPDIFIKSVNVEKCIQSINPILPIILVISVVSFVIVISPKKYQKLEQKISTIEESLGHLKKSVKNKEKTVKNKVTEVLINRKENKKVTKSDSQFVEKEYVNHKSKERKTKDKIIEKKVYPEKATSTALKDTSSKKLHPEKKQITNKDEKSLEKKENSTKIKLSDTKKHVQTTILGIKGIVINSRNNEPVEKAKVIVNRDTIETVSTGKFILSSIEVSTSGLEIKIIKDGFFDKSDIIEIDRFSNNLKIKMEPKIRIVLADFKLLGKDASIERFEKEIPQSLKNDFVACNDIEVLARDHLMEILGEIEYEKRMKGIFDPKTIVKTGKMVGANYIITGRISSMNNSIKIQAQMTDIEKATVLISKTIIEDNIEEITKKARLLSLTMISSFAEVKILKPERGEILSRLIEVSGTNSCIPQGWNIWVSILPFGTAKHYIQDYATVAKNKWLADSVYLGGENTQDKGRKFGVYVILADPIASEIFNEYIRKQGYEGFRNLPEGARICDNVVVIRK